ncbi:MAG TPA: hypothetical protein PKY96_11110, partial [Flavobacteriales bacterium]|nr:hypothetical protein [Flavobacteriales bacterium]
MRRQGMLVLAVLMACAAVQAQPYWKRLGRGTVGPTQFHALYGDSVSDRLLAGGSFLYLMNETDTILGVGQAAWNGHRWDSLATRVQPIGGNTAQPTFWFLRHQGSLFANGAFGLEYEPGSYSGYLARLNETTQRWEHLHCPIAGWSRITQLVPKGVPGQWLYATGHRDTICGLPQRAAFRYNGEQFEDWPPFAALSDDHSDYVGHVFEYQGMVHATGVLYNMFGGSIACFIRYNGTAWEPVPGWPLCPGPIKDIHIQGDTLYVCGAFTMSQGAPGNLIACYDGNAWHNMGGGLRYTVVPNGEVALTMHRWRGDLYVGGVFDRAGDVP